MTRLSIIFPFFLLLCTSSFGQSKPQTVTDIEDLINKEQFEQADKIVRQRIDYFIKIKNADTLSYYAAYVGKLALYRQNIQVAKQEAIFFLNNVRNKFPYAGQLVRIHTNLAYFFGRAGDYSFAYHIAKTIDDYFSIKRHLIPTETQRIYFALGDFASEAGKYDLARSKYLMALQHLKKVPYPDKELIVIASSALGLTMRLSSKLDSAVYYYKKSLGMIDQIKNTPYNYFRRSVTENSLGAVYSALGQPNDALRLYQQSFDNGKKFIDSPTPHDLKKQASLYQLHTASNMGAECLRLNNFTKANDFFKYVYEQKIIRNSKDSFEMGKSLIPLAVICNNRHQYEKALSYGLLAIDCFAKGQNDLTGWAADAYSQVATAFFGLKNNDKANTFYKEADLRYRISEGKQYTDQYLNFQGLLSDFYIKTGQNDKAKGIAEKGLYFSVKTQGLKSFATAKSLKHLAAVQVSAGSYAQSKKSCESALRILHTLLSKSKSHIDSLNIEKEMVYPIVGKARSSYFLRKNPDSAFIKTLLSQLKVGTKIVEKQKFALNEQEDINLFLAENKSLTDFIKQLNIQLLKLSGNKKYVDDIVNTHENSIYTRIRSRMDKQKAIHFAHLSDAVQEEEAKIKKQMTLKVNDSSEKGVQLYIDAIAKWNVFQQKLKTQYPAYYKMRYGSSSIPVKELCKLIPEGLTVVRYIFSDSALFALVASKYKQAFITLQPRQLDAHIVKLNGAGNNEATTTLLSYQLYQQLWQPLQNEIKTKRVMVIPDGILYHLSFEILTPIATSSFAGLSKKCLLNKYAISYHYSLLELQPVNQHTKRKGNFVAFVPGFSDKEKQQYLSVVQKDSLNMDRVYLSLLPLPFTTKLADKISATLGGSIFSNNASTLTNFQKEADNHRIIHIGTHAEANNDYPEYSRLIFAKDSNNFKAENSVYLYDIYNYNLNSDLAVLTACESGKPGYQDGEGMISMAHAFNYAGSKSMMTGLWKLDEQATTIITESFYNNLRKGLSKDESLQQAKLRYLENADGRMLAPQYWAGLVIMGDISPIELSKSNSFWYYIVVGITLFLTAIAFFLKRKR